MFSPGFGYFLNTAAALQWDEAAVDLGADLVAWRRLPPAKRARLRTLVAGFCVGERSVADQLTPFAHATAHPDAARCFAAQAADEERHARFFDRVAGEVIGVPGTGADGRRATMRRLLGPDFLELFELRLPEVARELARDPERLDQAVALYHLLLEGIVFGAGQLALLDLLRAEPDLRGLRRGTELVLGATA